MATILIVDDHLEAIRPLALLMRHMGHTGICVDSGEKALTFLRDGNADLVILDAMMPGMDGIEVLRRVRADPRTARIPVVMFSALSDAGYQAHARLHGANDYWVKASLAFDEIKLRIEHQLRPQN
jgi:CheY-like chemotaxis protein